MSIGAAMKATSSVAASLVLLGLVAACGRSVAGPTRTVSTPPPSTPAGSTGTSSPETFSDAALDLDDTGVPDDADPAARAGAAARFVDCEGDLANGGWGPGFGPPGAAPTAEGGLAAFATQGIFTIPSAGYTRIGRDGDRALFTYTADGAARVAVIVTHTDGGGELAADEGWVVESFAMCDPAEFAPAADDDHHQQIWTDDQGNRVPTSTVTSFAGPSHCNWETVTFLHLEDRQYLRDPDGLLRSHTVAAFDPNASLPDDATDTGYDRDGAELWLSADQQIAYLFAPEQTEAWPSTVEPVACA